MNINGVTLNLRLKSLINNDKVGVKSATKVLTYLNNLVKEEMASVSSKEDSEIFDDQEDGSEASK